MSSLATLSAHLLCAGYGPPWHSSLSLSLGVENAPVKLVPRHLPWTPHQSVPLALWLCFLCFFVACPWDCASCLWPALSIHFCWHRVHSVAGYPSGHCHLPRSLSLYLILSPFSETLFSQSSNSAIPGQGTHLVIGMIFRTQKRNIPLFPAYVAWLHSVVLKVCSLDLQH